MLKARYWIGVVSAPILLASAGCSIGPRPFATASRGYSPERMMAMARTFERQGHIAQAKTAYLQVLAVAPAYPDAQESLDTLIAGGSNQKRRTPVLMVPQLEEQIAQATPAKKSTSRHQTQEKVTAERAERVAATPKALAPLSTTPVAANALPELDATPSVATPAIPAAPASVASDDLGLQDDVASVPSPAAMVASDADVQDADALVAVATPAEPVLDAAQESLEFFEPITSPLPGVEDDLKPFFGPFRVTMVESLKVERERFQSKLAMLATDHDADSDIRSRAIFLLGAIGPEAIDVVPQLRREMHEDADNFLRVDLSEAILKIQAEDHDAINVLVDLLKDDSDQEVRWVAAFALRSAVSPRTTFVIDSLREMLDSDDLKLKRMVFLTLAEFGPAAAAVIPQLEAALESSDPGTREVAKACLACIVPDTRTTDAEEPSVRQTEYSLTK